MRLFPAHAKSLVCGGNEMSGAFVVSSWDFWSLRTKSSNSILFFYHTSTSITPTATPHPGRLAKEQKTILELNLKFPTRHTEPMIQQKKEFLRMLFIEHFLQLLSVHLPCLGQSTKLTWGLLESKTNTKPGQHEWSNRTSIMINLWPHVTACLCIMRMLNKRKPFFGSCLHLNVDTRRSPRNNLFRTAE